MSKINDDNNPSIRTEYGKNRFNKKNRINRVKSPEIEKRNYYNNKPSHVKDSWSNLISKTSKEGQNKPPRNSDNNTNIFNSNSYYNKEKNHFKKSNNYEMGTTTQITTLPGGVKRNMYEINDDMYLKKPFNESRMYKMIHDFNADLNYKDNYNPITQGYNVNEFPRYQRYLGSYRRDVQDHDIFNTNFYNKYKYY